MMDVKDEIKERLSIVDIVSGYVALKPAGKNYVGLSPFTTEKTPSFYVSPDRGLYYCFSTSQGGDMFTFVQKMEGIDFRGALKILAEKAGVSLRPEDRKQWEEKDVLFSVMEEATAFFEQALTRNTRALEYLKGRGLKDETIKVFRLGFAGTSWRDLKDHLLHKGYSENHIEKAGLIKHAEKGSYDRFRSRIMFPISDSSGRIIAFSEESLLKMRRRQLRTNKMLQSI
jgi:DNA primase